MGVQKTYFTIKTPYFLVKIYCIYNVELIIQLILDFFRLFKRKKNKIKHWWVKEVTLCCRDILLGGGGGWQQTVTLDSKPVVVTIIGLVDGAELSTFPRLRCKFGCLPGSTAADIF